MALISFEKRELKSHAEPVSLKDLRKGEIYFAVQYLDAALKVPVIETLVFIGIDLNQGDHGRVYFQTANSYQEGLRFELAAKKDMKSFRTQAENQLKHIFEFESALNEIMKCSLRRQK